MYCIARAVYFIHGPPCISILAELLELEQGERQHVGQHHPEQIALERVVAEAQLAGRRQQGVLVSECHNNHGFETTAMTSTSCPPRRLSRRAGLYATHEHDGLDPRVALNVPHGVREERELRHLGYIYAKYMGGIVF